MASFQELDANAARQKEAHMNPAKQAQSRTTVLNAKICVRKCPPRLRRLPKQSCGPGSEAFSTQSISRGKNASERYPLLPAYPALRPDADSGSRNILALLVVRRMLAGQLVAIGPSIVFFTASAFRFSGTTTWSTFGESNAGIVRLSA